MSLNKKLEDTLKISLTPIMFMYSYFPDEIIKKIEVPCLIKTTFGCECPGCGITRGIKSFLNLDFEEAINYNLLSPLVLFLITHISITTIIKYINLYK